MTALIVTNVHNNRGEVKEIEFTDKAYYYSDDDGKLYSINDFVDVDAILHEHAKADRLVEYWTLVSCTILQFLAKERAENEIQNSTNNSVCTHYSNNANK